MIIFQQKCWITFFSLKFIWTWACDRSSHLNWHKPADVQTHNTWANWKWKCFLFYIICKLFDVLVNPSLPGLQLYKNIFQKIWKSLDILVGSQMEMYFLYQILYQNCNTSYTTTSSSTIYHSITIFKRIKGP